MKLLGAHPRRNLLLLAVGLTVLRLVAGGTIHLTEDEAYYRLWAQHPHLGYVDHPPMIAWWIWAGSQICGDNALGVRLLPAIATGVATWLIGDLAQRLGAAPRTAFRAALWYNATLTVCLGGMLATPDTPASFFWTLTLWSLALFWERGRAVWWLAAGLSAGLAVLSKYSGLFLAPGVLLWLLLIPGGRAELRRPGPWEAALLAIFVFAVNVVWNSEHHWITFVKQFGRVQAHVLTPGHFLELLVTQFLLLTPLISFYAVKGVRQSWRERGQPGCVHLMLPVATAAPFAIYLVIHSLHDRVQGHWPAPLFGAFAICAAVALDQAPEGRLSRVARWAAPGFGLTLGAIALALLASPVTLPGRYDLTAPLRGWPQFASDVERRRAETGAAWVGVQSYGVLAQLALADRIAAPVLQVIERDRYDKEPADHPDFSKPGLIVDLSRRMKSDDLLRCFAKVAPAGPITRAGGATANERYVAYLVSGPRRDVWIIGCPAEVSPGVWR
ncbi:MAG TPA: glycosyltransferase family 39 protein [Phenylobacterium sp.]|nr:glycosyltransferase family 39 protein [Phenylobacterium sp.]